MAIINRDDFFSQLNSGAKWDAAVAFKRGNPLPLDDKSVFDSLENAQTYAQSATAYPGQVIAVVTASETTFYGINQAGELQDVGGSSDPMIFVADEGEMLALEDIKVGQQVYREDTHTIWLYKGGAPSEIGSWVESASGNDTVWQGTENRVNFYALTMSQYAGVSVKDTNTLYFVTDAGKIYKGDIDVTTSIVITESFPEASAAIANKLYVNSTTLEMQITSDNASWITLSPGYLSDGSNWAEADGKKLATIALIKKGIQEAITAINLTTTFENSTGTIKVGDNQGAVLTGVAHDPQYDRGQLKLTIPVYGSSDIVVNIPKDKFVKSGKYYEQYPEEEPTQYKVIVLEVESGSPVIIPAESLVDVYTADNEGKNVTVTVTDENKISAEITIDPVGGNALTYSEAGFKVDISGKVDTYNSGNASEILLSDAEGKTVSRSGKTVISGDTPLGTEDTQLATAKVIAAAISSAVSSAQSALQAAIDGKLDKLTGSDSDAGKIVVVDSTGKSIEISSNKLSDFATASEVANKVDKVVGTLDNVIVFGAEGALKDSTKSIGSSELSGSKDANKLATEAAVEEALSWNSI